MAKGDDLQDRLIDLAARIVRLCNALPHVQAARHIGGQLLRSGTAPVAHYAEARGAESRRDFVHKLKLCLKELNETVVWLEILKRIEILPAKRLDPLLIECRQLAKIMNASIRTANTNNRPTTRRNSST